MHTYEFVLEASHEDGWFGEEMGGGQAVRTHAGGCHDPGRNDAFGRPAGARVEHVVQAVAPGTTIGGGGTQRQLGLELGDADGQLGIAGMLERDAYRRRAVWKRSPLALTVNSVSRWPCKMLDTRSTSSPLPAAPTSIITGSVVCTTGGEKSIVRDDQWGTSPGAADRHQRIVGVIAQVGERTTDQRVDRAVRGVVQLVIEAEQCLGLVRQVPTAPATPRSP